MGSPPHDTHAYLVEILDALPVCPLRVGVDVHLHDTRLLGSKTAHEPMIVLQKRGGGANGLTTFPIHLLRRCLTKQSTSPLRKPRFCSNPKTVGGFPHFS